MDKILCGAAVYDTASRSFQNRFVTLRGARILSVTETEPSLADAQRIDCRGLLLLPGLVDVHTHGRAGFDFSSVGEADTDGVLLSYAKAGTTSVMATLASAPYEKWLAAAHMLAVHALQPHPGAHILGIHYEGRFLSENRRGAHAAKLLAAPSAAELHDMLRASSGVLTHISLAPELEGSEPFIREAVRLGATVGIAHTDCTFEEAQAALSWGAVSFTHTYNAMSPLHHRAPGCIGASLLSDGAYSELICDGMHSHPEMSRLLARMKPDGRLVLITDSMEATGCPDGNYSIAGLPVVVKDGRALTVEGKLAGSTLTLWQGLLNFMRFTGTPLEDALIAATAAPARMVGAFPQCGSIDAGKNADLLLVRKTPEYALEAVFCGGELLG